MRLKFSYITALIALALIHNVSAQICTINCPETSADVKPTTTAKTSHEASSSASPSPSSSAPSVAPTSSSVLPTSTSKSSSSTTHITTSSSSLLSTSLSSSILTSSSSSSSLSPTPSASTTPTSDSDSNSNKTGVIIGSVCGFIAVIGAGFAYAFFSKTRRQNRRNRNYQEQHDVYSERPYSDPFARPSPGLSSATALHSKEDLYQKNYTNQNQWEMEQQHGQYNYNQSPTMFSPVPAATPYSPPVNYPVQNHTQMNDPYYGYYDPNAVHQPYENYAAQPPPVTSNITNSNVYSSPHTHG